MLLLLFMELVAVYRFYRHNLQKQSVFWETLSVHYQIDNYSTSSEAFNMYTQYHPMYELWTANVFIYIINNDVLKYKRYHWKAFVLNKKYCALDLDHKLNIQETVKEN